MRRFAMFLATFLAMAPSALAGYSLTGADCGGFPRLAVGTMEGVCIGLVLQAGPDLGLVKPRKIAQVAGRDAFLLTDMGGWKGNRGALWLLEKRGSSYTARMIRDNLNLPHQIMAGPGGRYYLGEANRIASFGIDPDGRLVDWRVEVPHLPDLGENLHPLTHFIFLENNDLLVNVGATTDNCENEINSGRCVARTKSGLLRLYRHLPERNGWSPDYAIYATGLRNSMALVRHRSGTVLQAENGVDFKDAEKPYEEINVIESGGDYGWPYCYDYDTPHPAWTMVGHCRESAYNPPWTLMPPHTAPLDMMYYTGALFPRLKGRLIVPWHGYRATGHRITAYEVDDSGRPLRQEGAVFWSDPAKGQSDFAELSYTPQGPARPVAQHVEIAGRWNKMPGIRPRGAPVGLLQAEDGSIWIVDDKNRAVLRMAPGEAWRPGDEGRAKTASFAEDPALTDGLRPLLAARCASCHDFLKSPGAGGLAPVLAGEGWLTGPLRDSKLAAVLRDGNMPPGKPLPDAEQALMKRWFAALERER